MPTALEISCLGDLDPLFTLVSERTALIHAIANRYISTRGSLPEDEDYGYNLRDWLGEVIGVNELAVIRQNVEDEALKDERVDAASATVQFFAGASRCEVRLTIVGSAGEFQLVLGITDVSVAVLQAA